MNLRRRNTTKRRRTKEFLNNDGCLPRLAVPSPRDKGQSCGHVVQAHFHRWKVRKIGQKLCSGVSGEAAELQGWKPGATNWRHADKRDFCATLGANPTSFRNIRCHVSFNLSRLHFCHTRIRTKSYCACNLLFLDSDRSTELPSLKNFRL